jgi:tetratricopeptide (TPR) repeat protein
MQVLKGITQLFEKAIHSCSKTVVNPRDASDEPITPATNIPLPQNNNHHIIIMWFEPTYLLRNDFQQAFDKLNTVCYKINVFTNIDECLENLAQMHSYSKVYLLVPGMWAVDLLNQIQLSSWESIDAIYIYSSAPQQYEYLLEQNSCIQKIYGSIDEVGNAIHKCIDKRCEMLRFYSQKSVRCLSCEETTTEFIGFIAFKDALLYIPRIENEKNDMLDVCRRIYENDHCQLARIDEFAKTYRSEDAPKWFSRSCFLHKLVNRALRTQDVEQLYVFRSFIRDLSSWLSREFSKITADREKFCLYRGDALSQEEFQLIAKRKLFSPNGFCSTSRDIEVAKCFIGSSRPDAIRVLFKIECDMACYTREEIEELVAFADISERSLMPDEQEVLFNLGATFEIKDIKPYSSENDYFVIDLIPSCEGAHIVRDYRQKYQNEIENASVVVAFGALLYKTGKSVVAQHYFEQLLDDPGTENISDIYHSLGWARVGQGDYGRAIIDFERAHDMTPENDVVSKARILNSMGKVLLKKGYTKEPLSYYKKALNLRIAYHGTKHHDVAESYANIGRIYNLAGNKQLAFEYYQKSIETNTNTTESVNDVAIRETIEEPDSMKCSEGSSDSFDDVLNSPKCESISNTFYEMGSIQWELGESASGLRNMKRSLSLHRRSLPHSATKLHSSFHSLGNVSPLVNHDTKEIEYRLRCLEDVNTHPSESGVEITNALESEGSAYATAGMFKQALPYYALALRRREEQETNLKNSLNIARTANLVGDMHRHLHQFEQALECYRRAVTIYELFPTETNRDWLRTTDKILKMLHEMSLKTRAFSSTTTSGIRSASTSLYVPGEIETHLQQSQSIFDSISSLST